MKIGYISYSPIPSNRANSIQIMKMCNAFARNGHEVILLIPTQRKDKYRNGVDDVYEFYNVKNIFKIQQIPVRTFPLTLLTKRINYNLLALKYINKIKPDLVYGRSIIGCTFAAFFNYKVRIELHNKLPNHKERVFFNLLLKCKNLEKIIVVTHKLKEYYINTYKINGDKIIVCPNGADEVTNFEKDDTLRKRQEVLQVGYVGNLYKGKGMEIIVEVASKMPDVDFHIIGGTDKEIRYWKGYIKSTNIYFHGFIDQKKLTLYINSLDICLVPNQKIVVNALDHDESERKNYGDIACPLKIFQYMAHKKPIIASDLPVIRELLNENNAILVPPDDIDAWVQAIYKLKDEKLRTVLGNRAYNDFIENYTWKKRAERVLQ